MSTDDASCLEHQADDRLLIVNCDDLGSSHSANVAIFRAMTEGIATSASLMVPCPWAAEAASMFDGLPVGVHLTLTSEHPGYRWRSLTGAASLRDRRGFLPATAALALHQQLVGDIRAECRAQIDTALAWGIDVTHLDVHMDVLHANSELFSLYLDLAEQYALPIRPPFRDDFASAKVAAARGVISSDHLIYPWPRPTRDVIYEECHALPCGVTELFAHPVCDGAELRGYDLHHADIRVHDAAALTDPAVATVLKQHEVRLISHRELRHAQRTTGA